MMPSTISSRLITVANTGRRMDRSEISIASALSRRGGGLRIGAGPGAIARRAGLAHRAARPQLAGAVDDDAVARLKALADLDLPAGARADLDHRLFDLAVFQHAVDERLEPDLHDRDFRHHQRLPLGPVQAH